MQFIAEISDMPSIFRRTSADVTTALFAGTSPPLPGTSNIAKNIRRFNIHVLPLKPIPVVPLTLLLLLLHSQSGTLWIPLVPFDSNLSYYAYSLTALLSSQLQPVGIKLQDRHSCAITISSQPVLFD